MMNQELAQPPQGSRQGARVLRNSRKRLKTIISTPTLIPYGSYVETVLGAEYSIGQLIREEEDGDVYSVIAVDSRAPILEAKTFAWDTDMSYAEREKTDIGLKKLSRHRVCSINQVGRKLILYRCSEPPIGSKIPPPFSNARPREESSATKASETSSTPVDRQATRSTKRKHSRRRGKRRQQRQENGTRHVKVASTIPRITIKGQQDPETVAISSDVESSIVQQNFLSVPANAAAGTKGKRRHGKRGIKKLSIPAFFCIEDMSRFLEEQSRKSIRQQSELERRGKRIEDGVVKVTGAQVLRQDRMKKSSFAIRCQIQALDRRLHRALQMEKEWSNLSAGIEYDLDLFMWDDEEQWDMEEALWMLRKNPPIGPRSYGKPLVTPLLHSHEVYDWNGLGEFDEQCMWEIRSFLNGRENLYRRW